MIVGKRSYNQCGRSFPGRGVIRVTDGFLAVAKSGGPIPSGGLSQGLLSR
jgi:hypothetical protein